MKRQRVRGKGLELSRGNGRFVAKDPIPASVKHPLSLRADYANPKIWGGASFVVGVLSLIAAAAVLVLENWSGAAAVLGGLGLFLSGVGYWMYTRDD